MNRSFMKLGAAPILFTTVCAAAVTTIILVHHNQEAEKEVRVHTYVPTAGIVFLIVVL